MPSFDPRAIFPVIKSHDWFLNVNQNAVVTAPLFVENNEPANGLVIGYGFDQGETIGYLQNDTLAPEIPFEEVKQQALANLRRDLAQEEWAELDYSETIPDFKALTFTGHFLAAEALLLKERMLEAHSKLKAKKLLACTPVRGMLLVIPFDKDDKKIVEVFLSVCYENYHSGEQEPISSIIWAIHDGEIKGTLSVNQEFKNYHNLKTQDETDEASAQQIHKPEQTESTHHKPLKLYTPFQIALASFFGTLLAGFICLSLNYRSLKLQNSFRYTVIAATLIVPAAIAIFILIPDTPYDRLWPAATAIIMGYTAHLIQGNLITTHLKKGNTRKSFWYVAGVILASLSILLVFLIAIQMLFDVKLI